MALPAEILSSEDLGRWRYEGSAEPKANDGKQCARPTKLFNYLGGSMEGRCKATKEKKCRYCASIHRLNLRAVIASGLPDIGESDKPLQTAFLTLTAFGKNELPFDPAFCDHSSGTECSGLIGCRTDEVLASQWNEELKQNWNWFMTDLERTLKKDLPYWKCYELQARGVLHVHALVRVPFMSQKNFQKVVKSVARRWNFGDRMKVITVTSRNRGAISAYVGKYVTKGSGLALTVNKATGELREGGYRSWSASRDWGDSMAKVKEDFRERYRQALARREAETSLQRVSAGAGSAGAERALDPLYEKLRT